VWGSSLCSAALPLCCNYHGCSSINMTTELEMVSGRHCVCGGCMTARYCSAKCQKAHWRKWHKPVCKQLRQQRQQQQQQQQQQRQQQQEQQ